MNKLSRFFKDYKIFFKFWLIFLFIGALFRVALISLFVERFDSQIFLIFLYGARMDTIAFSAFGIIFTLIYAFNLVRALKILLTFFIGTYFLLEISTIAFMDYFATRPNYLFVEYMKNYAEVLNMVFELYKLEVLAASLFTLALIYKSYAYFDKTIEKTRIKAKLLALPFILILLALGTRSSLGYSTPNRSFYTFNNSNVHSEIANNSAFSVLYSIYLMKKEKFYDYGDIKYEEAIQNVKKLNGFKNEGKDFRRLQESTFDKKKNVILVILESFGHEYSGYLGGTNMTPNLDKLTQDSLYFTNLYATGTRTSWGVSAILTGLNPIPSREYVKANKSLSDFYTIATTLKAKDYSTTFLYSGDVDFDSMRGFMLSNGYENVYGKEDFDSSLHRYTWGYCDEDLYDKALGLIEESGEKPFFLTLLTMSSHEPFDYPKGKVSPYEGEKLEGFANSIKYSDYAIRKFMNSLKEKGLLEDTVVAFIADHNPKAYGKFDVPIDKYKIVALIVSEEFKGGREYSKIASQIDFGPTLLDVAGVDAIIPTMGSSILQNERDSALLLAKKKNFAYLTPEGVVIYKDKRKTQTYGYDLKKTQSDKKSVYDGLSYIYASKYLYDKRLYKPYKSQ